MISDRPLLTDDSIAFLEALFSHLHGMNPRVLEFGSGGSTVWFSRRTSRCVSIEHDADWHNQVRVAAETPVDLRLRPLPYHGVCDEFPDEYFDLVLVDGLDLDEGRMRVACARAATRVLRRGGILMFDNAQVGEYAGVYHLLCNWPMYRTVQRAPRPEYRALNETNWWIKP